MEKKDHDEFDQFLGKLPQKKNSAGQLVFEHKGFWFREPSVRGIATIHKCFKAHDSDIILATPPKSGTTWLKALTFAIVNRNKFPISESPMLVKNPHQLVPFLELCEFADGKIRLGDLAIDNSTNGTSGGERRIFATHLPYQCLPHTVLDGRECRIVFLCRNPLDTFTSICHFLLQNGKILHEESQPDLLEMSINQHFDAYCDGTLAYGPFWDQFLGYWNESLQDSKKVLFLKYEDLKKDTYSSVKKLAEFLGCGFTLEEENQGLVEGVINLCSLESLKNLECNKDGETQTVNKYKHSSFFRKGEVGGWAKFLTPSMAERLKSLLKEKFAKSGLTLSIQDC